MMCSIEPTEHLGLLPEHLGRYVLTCGSPKRAREISERLDEVIEIVNDRLMLCFFGYLDGEKVTVVTHGMGCPSIAIVLHELIELAEFNQQPLTVIRVGTAGSLQEDVLVGEVVLVRDTVRDEGTTKAYVDDDFEAKAHPEVLTALQQAVIAQKASYHVGKSHTKDALNKELKKGNVPRAAANARYMQQLEEDGVLASSMEAAALFVIGELNGVRTGVILLIVGSKHQPYAEHKPSPAESILIAIEAIRILICQDRAAAA